MSALTIRNEWLRSLSRADERAAVSPRFLRFKVSIKMQVPGRSASGPRRHELVRRQPKLFERLPHVENRDAFERFERE